nr:unnamed protein product [Callosobruchus chinensis]
MYCLYKEKCSEEAIPKTEIVKSWFYRHTFKTEFNLSFKVPSVDTCDQCDTYKVKIQESLDEMKNFSYLKITIITLWMLKIDTVQKTR